MPVVKLYLIKYIFYSRLSWRNQEIILAFKLIQCQLREDRKKKCYKQIIIGYCTRIYANSCCMRIAYENKAFKQMKLVIIIIALNTWKVLKNIGGNWSQEYAFRKGQVKVCYKKSSDQCKFGSIREIERVKATWFNTTPISDMLSVFQGTLFYFETKATVYIHTHAESEHCCVKEPCVHYKAKPKTNI